jgi:NADPH2:quinone reductase
MPGEAAALVKIEASGVNFIDIYHRTGRYQGTLPLTLGQEAAGTVAALGPGATGVKIGDRVAYASAQGAYAEFAAVPTWRLVPLPASMQFETAAAAMVQGMTAHYLCHSTYQSGEATRSSAPVVALDNW